MTQEPKETEQQRYERLSELINSTYADGDHPAFTPEQKRDFGEILSDSMTPAEFSDNIQSVGDIHYGIAEDYASLKDINLALLYVGVFDCESVDEWIRENGLPLPDTDGMIEHLIGDIDEEAYINEYYEDILDSLPEQCEFNLSDTEIVELFETFVEEPNYNLRDGAVVICDASEKFGCVVDDCIHAVPHVYNAVCIDPVCDRAGIPVSCVPVLVK